VLFARSRSVLLQLASPKPLAAHCARVEYAPTAREYAHRSGAHLDGSTTGPPTLSLAYLSTGATAKNLAAAANFGGGVAQQIAYAWVVGALAMSQLEARPKAYKPFKAFVS
jgi:hypothetical protein